MNDKFNVQQRLDNTKIFSKGLARNSNTSAALKFLSCFGLTCDVRPGCGDSFKEMTVLHFMRLMQIRGYNPTRATLKYAWPRAMNTGKKKLTLALRDLPKLLMI